MSDVKLLSKRLKELREHRKLTQLQLAEHLDIGRASIGNYENEDRIPDADVLIKFADFFGVTTDYLLGRSVFKGYGQEYEFRRRLGIEFTDNLNAHTEKYILTPNLHELNALLVSIDENYSSITTEIITGNAKFSTFALTALDQLFNMLVYTGKILKEDKYDADMVEYIEFLNKLRGNALRTSDFGHIQANQTQIKACTRYFNEFISFYIYSIIDYEK